MSEKKVYTYIVRIFSSVLLIFYKFFVSSFIYVFLRFLLGPLLIKSSSKKQSKLSYFFLSKYEQLLKLENKKPENGSNLFQSNSKPTVWIHAASGEIEYAKPIIRLLHGLNQFNILVTYSSKSIHRLIQDLPTEIIFEPHPLDHVPTVVRFLELYKPQALLISRTDLWPLTLLTCHQYKIPSLLFSYTLDTSKSHFMKFLILNLIDSLFVVSQIEYEYLKTGFRFCKKMPHLEVGGDTRYDQVMYRKKNPRPHIKAELFKPDPFDKPLLILASTWPEDEAELFKAVMLFKQFKIIIAPHEVSKIHLNHIENKISQFNLKSSRYTQAQFWNEDILILDQVGILADVYPYCDLAFVGGSFRSKVHSVMEPLSSGLSVLVGPFHRNNREAVEFSQVTSSLQPVQVANDSKEIESWLSSYLKLSPQERIRMKEQIMELVSAKQGASQKVMQWVKNHILLLVILFNLPVLHSFAQEQKIKKQIPSIGTQKPQSSSSTHSSQSVLPPQSSQPTQSLPSAQLLKSSQKPVSPFDFKWKYRLQMFKSESDFQSAYLTRLNLDLKLSYLLSPEMLLDLNPNIKLESGSFQSIDANQKSENAILLFQMGAHFTPVSFLTFSAGALDQSKLHSSLAVGQQAFPEVRLRVTLSPSDTLKVGAVASYAIPTSSQLKTETDSSEPSPTIITGGFFLNYEPSPKFYSKSRLNYYSFSQLPLAVMTRGVSRGNTPRQDRPNDKDYFLASDFNSIEFATDNKFYLIDSLTGIVYGSYIDNQTAPQGKNTAYLVGGGVIWNLISAFALELNGNIYRIEQDATLAHYVSINQFSSTNRIGSVTALGFLFPLSKYKVYMSYNEAGLVEESISQAREKLYSIWLETDIF